MPMPLKSQINYIKMIFASAFFEFNFFIFLLFDKRAALIKM